MPSLIIDDAKNIFKKIDLGSKIDKAYFVCLWSSSYQPQSHEFFIQAVLERKAYATVSLNIKASKAKLIEVRARSKAGVGRFNAVVKTKARHSKN